MNIDQLQEKITRWGHYSALLEAASIQFAMVDKPEVSIIIPIHNQLEYTLGCLASVSRHGSRYPFEVVLVDDVSDPLIFLLLQGIKGLRVVRNFKNLGFVHGCNRGASLARGRFLLFLNNDTEVTLGWLDALVDTFAIRKDAGLVGSKLLNTDGTLQEAGGILWRDGSAWNFGRNQDSSLPEFNYLRETDYCSGACIMIPRLLWRELHGFDGIYAPAYCEDSDLAFRVRAAGYKVYYQPASTVVHHEGKSNGTDVSKGLKQYQVLNQTKFLERWSETLFRDHFPNAQHVFWARDRSEHKTTILIIDHYVPHPDKDAGSRSVMSYIEYFLRRDFSVKLIGDNHFPHQPYTAQLEAMGVEVLVGQQFAENYTKWFVEHGQYINYVFLSRAHTSRRWLPLIRQHTSSTILFYGHDLISRTLERAAIDLGDESYRRKAQEYADHENVLFAESDWIFYPSEEEVNLLGKRLPQRKVARIPLFVYPVPDRNVRGWSVRQGLLFVGGFGHHPNCDAVKWFVSAIWPSLKERIPNLTFTIVGSRPPSEILALGGDGIRIVADATDSELYSHYSLNRVAVVPLRYGGGIKGKVLEAFFRGVPVVASPIAAEGIAHINGHISIAQENEFVERIFELYSNELPWSEQQAAAWEFLSKNYSESALEASLSPAIPELLTGEEAIK